MRDTKELYWDETADRADAAGTKLQPVRINYFILFGLFLLGSVVGFILEGFWNLLRLGFWEDHSALVWGPFCIIYGIAMAGLYAMAGKLRHCSWRKQFVIYALSGSALEFFGSVVQEWILGTVSWDYTHHFMNIGGRVSLQMTLIWGLLGLGFAKLVLPFLIRIFDQPVTAPRRIVCTLLSLFMLLDIAVSAGAILRWGERRHEPPSNDVERYPDAEYPDERMEKVYPNMTFR